MTATDDTLEAAQQARALNVRPDVVDLRDRAYTPSLIPLQPEVVPEPGSLFVRDQGEEGACTGFALAAVIDRQCAWGDRSRQVSTRMLYEMARLHDDIPDEVAAGSTLRGALKGFFHNGVCREDEAPYRRCVDAPPWVLDIDSARAARNVSLGAYYRLNHEINDYHAAINEAGAVIVSGKVHSGWSRPRNGRIQPRSRLKGRHAFAIVGYTSEGFLVQNSWGEHWGGYTTADGSTLPGVALWTYADWFENVEDAWVLRLAVSAPEAFDIRFARSHAVYTDDGSSDRAASPRRQSINGHFLHLDDGRLVSRGRYPQTASSVETTAKLIRTGGRKGGTTYHHLLVIAHGALQDRAAVANRIKAWRDVFKRNNIYPVHVMWETGFNDEVVDVLRDILFKTRQRMGSADKHLDARLEELARPLGHKLWRDLHETARLTFAPETDGGQAIRLLINAANRNPHLAIHFLGVSAGVLLLPELADAAADCGAVVESASLLGPACGTSFYDERIRPHIGTTIGRVSQYSLIDKREQADSVDVYSKSLLYLVANALECRNDGQLLGMEKGLATFGSSKPALPEQHTVYYAGRNRSRTDAASHRGFDCDTRTMNDVLRTVLDRRPSTRLRFSAGDLAGY